jgi:transcriptional regulator with GAF, ATPase, and Fis domain
MTKREIWLHFDRLCSDPLREEIHKRLWEAGFDTCEPDMRDPRGQGMLFARVPDAQVRELIGHLSRRGVERVLVVLTEETMETCELWALLRSGASEVFLWSGLSCHLEDLRGRLNRWEEIDKLVSSPLVRRTLVGLSLPWVSILRRIVEVAYFTDASVLITGESGTGKELVAELIHSLDPRKDKGEFVIVDCTTIIPELSGSEFFGHERGAFTGALNTRIGAFALANGGTLFLDEVGELPLALQAELMRVVQEGTFKRVGSNTWQRTHFRLICATNRNIEEEVREGRFRHDFYHRIAGWKCRLPPLRERTEDIAVLVRHFIQQLRPDQGAIGLDRAVEEYLFARPYPGNVRDLRQLVVAMMYRHVGGGNITLGDIPEDERPEPGIQGDDWCDHSLETSIRRALMEGVPLREIGSKVEDLAVRVAMECEGGSVRRAARRLGVTDRTVQMRRALLAKNFTAPSGEDVLECHAIRPDSSPASMDPDTH